LADTEAITASAVVTATVVSPTLTTAAGGGRLYYSGPDLDGHNAIFVVAATPGAEPARVVADAVQPALQPGGARLAFHTTRDDMLGLGGFDLATGERLRFTFNVEDTTPTWNPAGDQLFFGSTRYGDGRWRLYQVWADGNANATDMRYGQDPAWHPHDDLIVYKGCDDAGGHCGLWLMHSDGTERQPLTDNPGDARPRWAPDGKTVVFMSDQRDGNWELYTVAVDDGTVVRLSENAANDGLPVVSPDGTMVAFVSDRAGDWTIWKMPIGGGVAEQLLSLGELPNWLEQGLDWVE
jgi:Tol biopolymer transport system component